MNELDEREPTRGQRGGSNVRYAWLILTYALAADIFYRAGFARQTFGQIADLLFIWIAAQLFYVILEMSTAGSIIAAFRVDFIPSTVLSIVVAGGALIMTRYWSALVVTAGVTALALTAVLAMALLWKRRV